MIANALTIAGSDSGGGAGIQADLKTFSALGVYGASVIAALTAQNTRTVSAIHDVPPGFVREQIDTVMKDIDVAAVKIGMLSQPAVIEEVAAGLERHRPPFTVLDPVMIAKSGDALLQPNAVDTLRERLLPLATLITPNLPEAGVILGRPLDTGDNANTMGEACEQLAALGPRWVLIKGGHAQGDQSNDWLYGEDELIELPGRRVNTVNTHGTGCTLSSAVAALLARGRPMVDAVREAKAYVAAALASADRLNVGSGHGPVHHFHAWWTD